MVLHDEENLWDERILVTQCPMETLTRRRSWTHNALSGAILGGIAVERGMVGIPFGLEPVFHSKRVPLPAGAALVYGALAGAIAIFQGKPL